MWNLKEIWLFRHKKKRLWFQHPIRDPSWWIYILKSVPTSQSIRLVSWIRIASGSCWSASTFINQFSPGLVRTLDPHEAEDTTSQSQQPECCAGCNGPSSKRVKAKSPCTSSCFTALLIKAAQLLTCAPPPPRAPHSTRLMIAISGHTWTGHGRVYEARRWRSGLVFNQRDVICEPRGLMMAVGAWRDRS